MAPWHVENVKSSLNKNYTMTYKEAKFSRFMFHVKFSQSEEYLNEHELYEIMRSRDLYQSQYALRLNFKKAKRNLAKDEKQTRYSFENSRNFFLRKMQERLGYAEKMRNRISEKINCLSQTEKKSETKRDNLINTITQNHRSELPPLANIRKYIKMKELYADENEPVKHLSVGNKLLSMRTTSALATVCTSDYGHKRELNSPGAVRPSTENIVNRTLVAGRNSTNTVSKNIPVMIVTSECENDELNAGLENVQDKTLLAVAGTNGVKTSKHVNSKGRRMRNGRTLKFSTRFAPVVENIRGEDKAKAWAMKYCLVTEGREEMLQEADMERLLIDRPSKWGVNHYHSTRFNISEEDELHKSLSNVVQKKLREQSKLSLPDIHHTQKPMVTLEPGGTTPDGQLVLTKADYEAYLSKYRKARGIRLDRSKRKDKLLEKKIDTFRVEPGLCLRDETSIESSLRTI